MKIALNLVKQARENKLEDLTNGAIYFYNPKGGGGKPYAETKAGMEFMKNIANNPAYVMTTSDGGINSKLRHEFFARTLNSPPEGRELAEDTSFIADTVSPPEDQERPRGMRYGLDRVQPAMDKREITQFPERVLQ